MNVWVKDIVNLVSISRYPVVATGCNLKCGLVTFPALFNLNNMKKRTSSVQLTLYPVHFIEDLEHEQQNQKSYDTCRKQATRKGRTNAGDPPLYDSSLPPGQFSGKSSS